MKFFLIEGIGMDLKVVDEWKKWVDEFVVVLVWLVVSWLNMVEIWL